MTVTLIGYRGSGKSSVGRALAAALQLPFADADDVLELRAGKTIRQIFADEGEPAFRDLEEQTLTDLLSGDSAVIAAGGGAVLRESNRRRMNAAGPVVWLQATAEQLSERIDADTTTAERRPNLTSQGGLSEIQHLLQQREPLYRDIADFAVETDGRTVDEIVAAILAELAQRGSAP